MERDEGLDICPLLAMLIDFIFEFSKLACEDLKLRLICMLASVQLLSDHEFSIGNGLLLSVLQVDFLLVLDNIKSFLELFLFTFELSNLG